MMTALHVIFGTLALAAAPISLCTRKGGIWHRRFGAAFTMTMAIVLFSAGFLWQAQGHLFLLPLSLVSAYLIFSSWRSIARHRRPKPDPFEDRVDLLAGSAAVLAGGFVAYLGATPATPLMHTIQPALLGVGLIAMAFAANDMLGFAGPRLRFGWLLTHFAAMVAAYISAVTAFLVINAHGMPMLLRWLIPSAVGSAVIVTLTLRTIGASRARSRAVVAPATASSVFSQYTPFSRCDTAGTPGSREVNHAIYESSSGI